MMPNQQVFNKLLRQSADSKPFKQKKVPLADFERAVGVINASVSIENIVIAEPTLTILILSMSDLQ